MGNRKEGAGMKPILFQTDMVKAILESRKTQTRRIVKPQPAGAHTVLDCEDNIWYFMCGHIDKHALTDWTEAVICPHRVGDILWVRETWLPTEYGYVYKNAENACAGNPKWRPSIHMPKEAARIFLEVTEVRVERVNDITEEDAIKEGIARHGVGNGECYAGGCYNGDFNKSCGVCDVPKREFSKLWDSINLKRGYGWETNPWVWVIEFERTEVSDD